MGSVKLTERSFVQQVLPSVRLQYSEQRMEVQSCLRLLSQHLVRCVSAELQSGKYVYLDFPNHSNIGDHAIYLGAKYLLNKHLNAACIYSADISNFSAEKLQRVAADVPIIFHGGGNLGDVWPRHQLFRERILQKFPERRFIIFPQTMSFQDGNALKRAQNVFRAHTKLTIFLRDQPSYQEGLKHFGEERVRLAPDPALCLIDVMPSLLAALAIRPNTDQLYLLRTDKEKERRELAIPVQAMVADWPTFHTPVARDRPDSEAHGLAAQIGLLQFLDAASTVHAWRHVLIGLKMILKAKHLVTDRLHGHILALLCGVPHTLFPSQDHKIPAFYNTWTAGIGITELIEAKPHG